MIYRRLKESTIIEPEDSTDIWYLFNILKPGDKIKIKTHRVVEQFKEKKPVTLKLEIEKIKYMKEFKALRVTGKILEGHPSEYVQIGRYHSIDIKPGVRFELFKEWAQYEKELLEEASQKSKKVWANVVLIDERKAEIYRMYSTGFEFVSEVDLGFSKKAQSKDKSAYLNILERLEADKVIVAGPGFEKYAFGEFLKKAGKQVSIYDVSYAESSSLKELFKVAQNEISQMRLAEEEKLVEEIMKRLGKNDPLIAYGDIKDLVEAGAVEKAMLLEESLESLETRELLKKIEEYGGKVIVFSSDSPWADIIRNFGIVAFLRYRP